MAALKSPQQEAFAHAIVTGVNQSDAYRSAYKVRLKTKPESVNQAASRLMADINVASRVEELRKPVVDKAQITLESHLARLQVLSEAAEVDGQFSAAISAEVARGKAAGIAVDKSQINISGSIISRIERVIVGVK